MEVLHLGTGPDSRRLSNMPTEPKQGEDVRLLYKIVREIAQGTNALLNMTGTMDGRAHGIFGEGGLRVTETSAELRIDTAGQGAGIDQFVKQTTAVNLVSSKNPSDIGIYISFAAYVSTRATGTITFIIDGANFGTYNVVNGAAGSSSLNTLTPGQHSIRAHYSGDNLFNSADGSISQVVNGPNPPTVDVKGQPNPSRKGIDNVIFVATVTGVNPIPPAPNITGSVDFYIDGSFFQTVALTHLSGQQWQAKTSPINWLSFGNRIILARYTGDRNYGTAYNSYTQNVVGTANVVLTINPNPVPPNSGLTLRATVSGSFGVPTGTVQFSGPHGNIGGPVGLSGGVAALGIGSGPTEGNFGIAATYSGNNNYTSAVSPVVNLVVKVPELVPTAWVWIPPAGFSVYEGQAITQQLQGLDGTDNSTYDGPITCDMQAVLDVYLADGSHYYGGMQCFINGSYIGIPFTSYIPFTITMTNGLAQFVWQVFSPMKILPGSNINFSLVTIRAYTRSGYTGANLTAGYLGPFSLLKL